MKVSVEMFQKLYNVAKMDMDEIDKSSLLIQTLTGKNEDEINAMSIKKYGKLCNDTNKLFERYANGLNNKRIRQYVKANGQRYFLNFDLRKEPMNAGRYVEVATYSSDIIENLHKIMATMATPMFWSWKGLKLYDGEIYHAKIANDMLKLDFEIAYHSSLFFCAVLKKSTESLNTYFMRVANHQGLLLGENLARTLDGYTMPKWYQNLKI